MLGHLSCRLICPATIVVALIFSSQIAAQSGVTEVHTTASANISVPLQLDKSEDMSFGLIAANNGGEVTLNFDGTREITSGDVAFVPGHTGDVHAASFEAKGHPHSDVQILFPSTMEISNGSETMTLTLLSSVGTSANLFDNPPANRLFFEMGAVLEIGSDQAPGEYEGTFNISVVYE